MTDAGHSRHLIAIVFAALVAAIAVGMFLSLTRQAGGSQGNLPQAGATAVQNAGSGSGLPWG